MLVVDEVGSKDLNQGKGRKGRRTERKGPRDAMEEVEGTNASSSRRDLWTEREK